MQQSKRLEAVTRVADVPDSGAHSRALKGLSVLALGNAEDSFRGLVEWASGRLEQWPGAEW